MKSSDKSSRPSANSIKLGDHSFETLLAITAQEQERGLMGVPPPAPVMTFIYGTPSLQPVLDGSGHHHHLILFSRSMER